MWIRRELLGAKFGISYRFSIQAMLLSAHVIGFYIDIADSG